MSNAHIKPSEVAARLGVKHAKVLGWIKSGELEAFDVSIRAGVGLPRWRVTQDALDRFLARRANTTPKPQPKARRRNVAPDAVRYV